MHAAALTPNVTAAENARINRTSVLTGLVSFLAAGLVGANPAAVGLAAGGLTWAFGKACQALK